MIDAKAEELEFIANTIKKNISNCEIRVFGSRIKGNSRKYSDIDLALVSDEKIDWFTIEKIKDQFAESELPYRVDILDWNCLNDNFKEIINSDYKVI